MNHYSTIVKNQIESDMEFLKKFKYGNLLQTDVIVKGTKSIAIKYSIYSAYKVEYELIYFNELENSDQTISLEEVDSIFILTAEEYVVYLQDKLGSDSSGIDAYGHWYIPTGDDGWMGFHDGQYVIAAYGFMNPDNILNKLCHEQVRNHSNDRKSYDRTTGIWTVIK
jgi:hypothetical protein